MPEASTDDGTAVTHSAPMLVEAVVECGDLDEAAAVLFDLGFRLATISPADAPAEMTFVARDGAVRLVRSTHPRPGRLIVRSDEIGAGVRPIGASVVEIRPTTPSVVVPPSAPTLTISRVEHRDDGVGRAGMRYRDLLPDRWGGRFIASHITIPDGGAVPDYVHFHRIRFQMIFVAAGWVDVVYEDQGEAFRMHAGDCVLQPPEIRHRVLHSSPGLEVIEVGCPAVHDTVAEHEIVLPTATVRHDRTFAGQRFVRHVAAGASLDHVGRPGWTIRDTGIGAATDGLAGVRVLTASTDVEGRHAFHDQSWTHDGEYLQLVVLGGAGTLRVDVDGAEADHRLASRDAVAIPPRASWEWVDVEHGRDPLSLLEITLPHGAVRPIA